jgi:hypothetical protein
LLAIPGRRVERSHPQPRDAVYGYAAQRGSFPDAVDLDVYGVACRWSHTAVPRTRQVSWLDEGRQVEVAATAVGVAHYLDDIIFEEEEFARYSGEVPVLGAEAPILLLALGQHAVVEQCAQGIIGAAVFAVP